jgi:hypothetical protein
VNQPLPFSTPTTGPLVLGVTEPMQSQSVTGSIHRVFMIRSPQLVIPMQQRHPLKLAIVVVLGAIAVRLQIPGFATKEVDFRGRKRALGPSGISIGEGLVYIGDRADSSVCAVDERTRERKTCGHIDSTPDGVVYVAPTNEV